MKLLLLIAFAATFIMMASSLEEKKDTEDYSWENFKQKFNRDYTGQEEAKRKAIFDANVAKIKAHNEKYHRHETTYLMGINQFADRAPEEVKPLFGVRIPDKHNAPTST